MNKVTLSKSNFVARVLIVILVIVGISGAPSAQDTELLPLSEPGPYAVGTRDMTFVDESRNDKIIKVNLWYPAVEAGEDAAPDASGAPYPLVVYSMGGQGAFPTELAYLTSHLASLGYVVAAPNHPWGLSPEFSVHRPLDVIFVIDQFAGDAVGDLAGVADLDRVGSIGYSLGGVTALQMAGMVEDPDFYMAYCDEQWDVLFCMSDSQFATFNDTLTPYFTWSEEGLKVLPPVIGRIDAVVSMAPCFGPIFGERGLGEADVPTLIIAGETDQACPYERDARFMFDHLGSVDRYLISVADGNHWFGYGEDAPYTMIVKQFTTAMLGYYLQGYEEYAEYLTEEFVNGIDSLEWGTVPDSE